MENYLQIEDFIIFIKILSDEDEIWTLFLILFKDTEVKEFITNCAKRFFE